MKMESVSCLNCGHEFGMEELAAITVRDDETEQCEIECTACGARNEVRAEPQPGAGAVPAIIVLRIAKRSGDVDPVFEETVEPGVHPPATTCGESN